jgi:large subunit ribosomal protein L15
VHIKGFEGGQMPLHMRMPKRGFNNIFRRDFVVVNVGQLQIAIDAARIDAGQPINGEVLQKAGVVRQVRDGIRLLGMGDLKATVTVEVAGASKSAVAAVEKVGGKVVLPPQPAAEPAAKS